MQHQEILNGIKERVALRVHQRVAILSNYEPVTGHSAVLEWLPMLGCIVSQELQNGTTASQTLLDFNPELILWMSEDLHTAHDLLARYKGFHGTVAAEMGDIYVANQSVLLADPMVLATILHPEVFTAMLPSNCVRIVIPVDPDDDDEDDEGDEGDEDDTAGNSRDSGASTQDEDI